MEAIILAGGKAERLGDAAAGAMKTAVFVDGRNMLDPQAMRDNGWTYEGIGRAAENGAA